MLEYLNAGAGAAAVADSYAEAAGWLAGIAAALLVVYLTRHRADDTRDHESGPPGGTSAQQPARRGPEYTSKGKPVGSRHVARALFFAMSALAICAFLYSSIVDDAVALGRLATEMMFFGAALGTSVLALFYAVTLMMLEYPVTRPAAKSAYWVLVIVGPGVVIRYIAGAAHEGWRLALPHESASGSPLLAGTATAVSLPLLMLGAIHRQRIRNAVGWVYAHEGHLKWATAALAHTAKIDGALRRIGQPLVRTRGWLRERPVAPAVAALAFAASATIGSSVVAPSDRNWTPNPVWSWIALGMGVLAIAYFALATFSVLAERVDGQPRLPIWDESSDA
jgi:hypothetical protein